MSERKPYVMYRLSAEIRNKGIGYNIKTAVQAFLSHHKLEGKFIKFSASSDHFEAVLALYNNGILDINMTALAEHIHTSGQMPTRGDIRPVVKIIPVDVDTTVQNVEQPKDEEWSKVVQGLHAQIKKKDESLEGLTAELNAAQRALNESHNKILTLETAVSEGLVEFKDPLSAIISGYLRPRSETMFEFDVDLGLLNGREEKYLSYFAGKPNLSFLQYFNHESGNNFSSEEFEAWKKFMRESGLWEASKEGIELKNQLQQLEADSKLYQTAKSAGVSEEMLKSIQAIVDKRRQESEDVAKRVEESKTKFERERSFYTNLTSLDKDYKEMCEVVRNSNERKKSDIILPILIAERAKDIILYVPSIDENNNIISYLTKIITSTGSRYHVDKESYERGVSSVYIHLNKEDVTPKNSLDNILANNSLINALGLQPKIIRLKL